MIETGRGTSGGWLRADLVLLVGLICFLLWFVGPVLLMVLAGVLLALAFDGVTAYLVRWTGLPRGVGLGLVILAFVLLLTAGVLLVVPSFAAELGQVWEQLSDLIRQAQDAVRQQPWARQLLGLGEDGDNQQSIDPGEVAARLASITMTLAGALVTVVIVFAIAIFMAAKPGIYRTGLLKLVPFRARPRADEVLAAIGHSLRWWLLGQLVSMTVLGTVSSLALWMVGVDAWLGLGLLVALLTFIPFLGPILAGIPVLVISFAQGLETGLIVLAFYVVLQNFEGNFLTPLVQQQAVHIPPALLISVQVLMGVVFGFAGLVLAAPLAVMGLVAVNLLYVEDVLGDRPTKL